MAKEKVIHIMDSLRIFNAQGKNKIKGVFKMIYCVEKKTNVYVLVNSENVELIELNVQDYDTVIFTGINVNALTRDDIVNFLNTHFTAYFSNIYESVIDVYISRHTNDSLRFLGELMTPFYIKATGRDLNLSCPELITASRYGRLPHNIRCLV